MQLNKEGDTSIELDIHVSEVINESSLDISLFMQIESVLFVASRSLDAKKIAKALGEDERSVEEALENIILKYNRDDSGIHIFHQDGEYRMSVNPYCSGVIEGFVKDEIAGELTRAQLETLTVVAYRGPITRPELEQIRGVNCSVIIRNLMIRGLVNESQEKNDLVPYYSLSLDALKQLGISNSSYLPDYDSLHAHEYVESVVEKMISDK